MKPKKPLSYSVEDRSIWTDFRAGCRKAYEQIIRSFYPELYRYGMRMANNPDFVKDEIHDLFVHIWEKREQLGDTDNIRLYLLKSLRHRLIRSSVRESRQTELDVERLENDLVIVSREEEMALSEELMVRKRRLGAFIARLTERQREVIHLRFYEGLSNENIAEIMNISKPAVANLLHASLKTLRAIWQTAKLIFVFLFF